MWGAGAAGPRWGPFGPSRRTRPHGRRNPHGVPLPARGPVRPSTCDPSARYGAGTHSATRISPTFTVPATSQMRSTNPPIRARPRPSDPAARLPGRDEPVDPGVTGPARGRRIHATPSIGQRPRRIGNPWRASHRRSGSFRTGARPPQSKKSLSRTTQRRANIVSTCQGGADAARARRRVGTSGHLVRRAYERSAGGDKASASLGARAERVLPRRAAGRERINCPSRAGAAPGGDAEQGCHARRGRRTPASRPAAPARRGEATPRRHDRGRPVTVPRACPIEQGTTGNTGRSRVGWTRERPPTGTLDQGPFTCGGCGM